MITFAVGHLLELIDPEDYDEQLKKWRMADLPIIPDEFRVQPRDAKAEKQLKAIDKLLQARDVERVINACDAGREGELIFAYIYETVRSRQARRAPLDLVDDEAAIRDGLRAPAARHRAARRSRRPPARAPRPTGSSA